MNNNKATCDIMNEFNKFKYKHEEIEFMSKYKKFSFYDDKAIYVIFAEFMVGDEDEIKKINIHYEYNYWGNVKFNEWLSNHNLEFEWFNSCVGLIYKN